MKATPESVGIWGKRTVVDVDAAFVRTSYVELNEFMIRLFSLVETRVTCVL